MSWHTCVLSYAMKDTYSFTAKYSVTEVQKRSQEISLYIAVALLHIFRVLKHNARLAVFPHALLSQLATSHTDDHELFELIKVMVVTVNHWHLLFRRVQGIVTKEGMLLKTSSISAAAGALLLLALLRLRLHGRASLDSCSSRASRDHKALTGHL